jgi:outer membrane lipopolysaccharide assembly protein LptE/RlpB
MDRDKSMRRRETPAARGIISLILAAMLCGLLAGCGYQHAGYGSSDLLAGNKTISVPLFLNKTYRPNLEVICTASLVDEFAKRSGGKVVKEDVADLLLSGTVASYYSLPVAYTSIDTIKEYRVSITVKATLRDRPSQKVLWKGELTDTQTYPVFTDIALQQNAEEAAIREILRKIAQRLYQKINEQF